MISADVVPTSRLLLRERTQRLFEHLERERRRPQYHAGRMGDGQISNESGQPLPCSLLL